LRGNSSSMVGRYSLFRPKRELNYARPKQNLLHRDQPLRPTVCKLFFELCFHKTNRSRSLSVLALLPVLALPPTNRSYSLCSPSRCIRRKAGGGDAGVADAFRRAGPEQGSLHACAAASASGHTRTWRSNGNHCCRYVPSSTLNPKL
jgi:hypothetical protein